MNTGKVHIIYGLVIACCAAFLFDGYRQRQAISAEQYATERHRHEILRLQQENTAFKSDRDSAVASSQRAAEKLDTLQHKYHQALARIRTTNAQTQNLRQMLRDSLHTWHSREREYREKIFALGQQIIESTQHTPTGSLRFWSVKSNEKIIYIGHIRDNTAWGYGIGVWENGSVYEGEWKDNKRHGKGTHLWKDGVRYEGEFLEDYRTGTGTYYWKNGDKYVGQWQGGKRNGIGTVYDKNGEVKVIGKWADDKLVERLAALP